MRLVLIHGRAPKPPKPDLQDLWFEALRRSLSDETGFDRVSRDMVYYGDLSNEFLAESCTDIADRRAVLESIENADFQSFEGELTYDIETPTDDILAYWDSTSQFAKELRQRIRERFAPLLDHPEPVMLLAHSLGAVLTYDALCEVEDVLQHMTLVTLGSPLTHPHFLSRSKGTPAKLAAWHNISARGDKICGPRVELNQNVVEHEILNPVLKSGDPDPHHALGYLRHPVVGKLVSDWLLRGR